MQNIITAKYAKNQALVNKLYKFDRLYHDMVNQYDYVDGLNDSGQFNDSVRFARDLNKIRRWQEAAFNKQDEIYEELSVTETKNVERQYYALHGYGIRDYPTLSHC